LGVLGRACNVEAPSHYITHMIVHVWLLAT